MNYNEIFLFVKLVNVGNFKSLAKLLNSTKATMVRRIEKLEAHLSLQLLKKNSKQTLEITADGARLYEKFKDQELALNNTLDEIKHQRSVLK